jgi:hypothetical protein
MERKIILRRRSVGFLFVSKPRINVLMAGRPNMSFYRLRKLRIGSGYVQKFQ